MPIENLSLNSNESLEVKSAGCANPIQLANISNIHIDFSKEIGEIQALHGVNFGPLSLNGIFDFSKEHKELKIPSTRLHDCPYAIPGTIDIHCLFPLFHADHTNPKNYIFPISDDYIQSIIDVGSDIVFRLGETIEHHKRGKYFIHPPKDFEKWAEICVQIIRHYNEGWANGFHHDIKYWEIWNEPWALCWTGTAEEFYQLYEITSKRIKQHNPSLKVGSGGTGSWDDFCNGFVHHCKEKDAPLDYLVWHSYQHHPKANADLAREMRIKLDEAGFPETELHLNEWAHNPDNDWSYIGNGDLEKTKKAKSLISRIQGAPGAAFTATMLCWMQDLPVDLSNYYWAREGIWGLFDHFGGKTKLYNAFEAFVSILNLKTRVQTNGNDEESGIATLASISKEQDEAAILISHFESTSTKFILELKSIPWNDFSISTYSIDNDHSLTLLKTESIKNSAVKFPLSIPAPGVMLLKLQKNK